MFIGSVTRYMPLGEGEGEGRVCILAYTSGYFPTHHNPVSV